MSFLDGTPTHQSTGYDPSSSTWSLAYHYIGIMVFMIEPRKEPALLSNLSALQTYSATDICEA